MYIRSFAQGKSFQEFMDSLGKNEELWRAMVRRAQVDPEVRARVARVPGRWRLLVLAEDWCGDAVNILPVIASLADGAPNVDLRIVGREDHPGLMERHLTKGARSIPVAILLDEEGRYRGWWGPRPAALQAWFDEEGRGLPPKERYRELRRRYARDRGAAVGREIARLIECGAERAPVPYQGTRPCHRDRAA